MEKIRVRDPGSGINISDTLLMTTSVYTENHKVDAVVEQEEAVDAVSSKLFLKLCCCCRVA